jgi:hypothetical protein
MDMLKKTLLLLFFFSVNSFSQNPKLSEKTKVSIFTCGRGEELYSTFGHTALRIKDDENLLDVVFNYGAFDFRTEPTNLLIETVLLWWLIKLVL